MKLALASSSASVESARKQPAIQVSNLSIVFDTKRGQMIAVDRVSFDVAPGEFVCIALRLRQVDGAQYDRRAGSAV
jgi:NitT/TauT family transport system ATP-binding protein